MPNGKPKNGKPKSARWIEGERRRRRNGKSRNERRLRERAVAALGGCCAACGNDDYRVLEIDHVYGDGDRDRQEKPNKGSHFRARMRQIITGHGRSRFQVLCANCHRIKTYENRDYLPSAAKFEPLEALPLFSGLSKMEH